MPSLNDALIAVTEGVRAAINDPAVDVADHPGSFSEAELGRMASKTRAVRVALSTVPETTVAGPGHLIAQLVFTVYIICSDTQTTPKHQACLALAEILLKAAPHQRWNTTYLQPVLPTSIAADNLYNTDIERKGVAMWGMAWQQGYKDT
jgi:hypothetical protein